MDSNKTELTNSDYSKAIEDNSQLIEENTLKAQKVGSYYVIQE